MKKLLVVAFLAFMTLLLTVPVMAGNFYLDSTLNGQTKGAATYDTKTFYTAGFNASLNDWYIGFDYMIEKVKDPETTEWSGYTIKGGYSFLNDDKLRVTGTFGYLDQTIKDLDDELKLTGLICLGLAAEFNFNAHSSVNFGFDYGVLGKECKVNGIEFDVESVLNCKLKYTYFFNQNVGASIGYNYYRLDLENGANFSTNGFAIGLNVKF